jgi:hypothetical protein
MLRLIALALALAACLERVEVVGGVQVHMDFARRGGFYDAPFPSDDLVREDGTLAVERFPNPSGVSLVDQGVRLLARDARGFAQAGGVFLPLTGEIDRGSLPSLEASVEPGAPVFLAGVDPSAPDYLRRYPVQVAFEADGGPFGAPNLLSVLPLQGIPLRPRTTYAAVVLRRLRDATGRPLGVSLPMAQLAAGVRPAGLSTRGFRSYRAALEALRALGVTPGEIAGLAVFTTDAPWATLDRLRADVLAGPRPAWPRLSLGEVFESYCVFSGTLPMPVYQQGTPPYQDGTGGDFAFDASGRPVRQRMEEANVVVTVPRLPTPPGGFPAAVFVRTGGGGDRPLVDRGPHATAGGAAPPGSGPALHLARARFVAVSVDGPHGGRRNVTRGDEQFLIFNLSNAGALRDNIRQSALELVLLAHLLDDLAFDPAGCPGAGRVSVDRARLAILGHSMGATIAPLAVALEPRYRAVVLSGAGGSWIENIVYKEKPIPTRPFAELLLGYTRRTLVPHDPVLTLVQWAAEPADPQVYASAVVREPGPGAAPRHVLMFQGIVDHYILPNIANALSLSLGLDLAGPALDARLGLAGQRPLEPLLRHSGRTRVPLPFRGAPVTAVVVQHVEDGIEDGHEVMFQSEAPQHQYRCFLEGFARGAPVVPAAGAECE